MSKQLERFLPLTTQANGPCAMHFEVTTY